MVKKKSITLSATLLLALYMMRCGNTPGNLTAFVNVNLVPMTDEMIIENQSVLIEGSRIIAIDKSNELLVPQEVLIIDGNDNYLMPGLADMHVHTRDDWDNPEIWPTHPLNLYLANGITTIRDFAPLGSPITYPLRLRDEIRSGLRDGPNIYASGKLLYASPLNDPEDIVRQNYDLGFDFIKLYSYLSIEDFQAAMKTANALGMYTAGHIPHPVGLKGVLSEGMDEIAHVEELIFEFIDLDRDKQLTPERWIPYIAESMLIQWDISSNTLQADFEMDNKETMVRIADLLRRDRVPVCTTMVVDEVIQLKLFQPEAFLERPENIYFEKGYVERFRQGEEKHQVQFRGMEDLALFKYTIDLWILAELRKAGVLLLLGTDSGTGGMGIVPGYSIHDELRILTENGFSPYEAIATGTINAAQVINNMTGENDLGTIEVGEKADLILVKESPLVNVGNIRDPIGVMANGRWYPRSTLARITGIPTPITSDGDH